MRTWAVAAIVAVALPVAGLAQTKPDKPPESVRISGRVVSPERNPRVVVIVARIENGAVLFDQSVSSDPHGTFTCVVEPGNKYRLYLWQGGVRAKATVDTRVRKDVGIGDLVLDELCPFDMTPVPPTFQLSHLKPDQISIEPQKLVNDESPRIDTLQSSWDRSVGPKTLRPREGAMSSRCSGGPLLLKSVGSFVGNVKRIRVVRYDPWFTPIQDSGGSSKGVARTVLLRSAFNILVGTKYLEY